ncbi:MAG TPA: nuclear transport factor 2 family protein [Solirubrobacterales bacterium]|nr:nuclear transport factor 2 family protein [Solirubrobacterales bacterium]
MSRENLEVVLAGYEAWNAGDMDAYGELLDPDVTWLPPEGWPEPGPFVGREAVLHQLRRVRETWEADAAEPISEPIDAGDKVLMRFKWQAKSRGPDASAELTCLYTVRAGKHLSFEFFWDHADALEAAGLSR